MKRIILFVSLIVSFVLSGGAYADLYFPHIDTNSPWGTEIAIINVSPAQALTGTLNAYSNTGQLIDTIGIALDPHGRRQITIADELANHTNIGYLIFETGVDTVQGYTKFYVSGQYRVAVPAVREVNTGDIYISHIASDGSWWTGVSLLNTTSSSKTLTLTFDTGQSKTLTLAGNEHRAFTIAGLFDGQSQPDINSAVITNASGVVGLELFGSGNQLSGILLKDDTASTIYYPHVAAGEWWTGIVAYNPSSSSATLTITPFTEEGASLATQNLDIGPGEKYIGTVSQLSLPSGTAWFRIDSTTPLTGFELFGTTNGNQLAGYTAVGINAQEGVFAKVEKDGWTGIAFVNTEGTTASVTLTAYDNYGDTVATQTLPLGSYAKEVRLAQDFFDQDIGAATYIGYTSDRELVGFQLNGSSDGMMLDGLPGMAPPPPQPYTISGSPILPDLEVDDGGLSAVGLYDLSFNLLDSDTDTDPSYRFAVQPGNAYILIVSYNNGQSFAAVTPTITQDLVQDITLDTEVAMNLIMATEQVTTDLEPSSLSRPLDDLLEDANQMVSNLNEFLADRNDVDARLNRPADRIADAVRSITLHRLNSWTGVITSDLSEWMIRAFGGGLEGIRSLSDMVSNPLTPLNPHFAFTRYNSSNEVDMVISDLRADRWDIIVGPAMLPHIVTGGDQVVYVAPNGTVNAGGYNIFGVYRKTLGSTDAPELLTPVNLGCQTPSLSPDQTRIVFSGRYVDLTSDTDTIEGPPFNLFVMDADGGNLTQITFDADIFPEYNGTYDGALWPSWSPDGSELVFSHAMFAAELSVAEDRLEKIRPDGSDRRIFFDRMTTGYDYPGAPKWSPDGREIVFQVSPPDAEGGPEIMVVASDFDIEENPTGWIFTDNVARDTNPDWSYDMRFIIFNSNRGGETGTLPGVSDLMPIYIMNNYTGDIVDELGDFTNAGFYYAPRFTGTETAFSVVEGQDTDEQGDAVIDPNEDTRTSDDHSSYNYYRETIPVANTIPNYNFGVTSWF
jgi:hypothetical protein